MNYIQMFIKEHDLKVGDKFRAKGLNINRIWCFDEKGYLLDETGNEKNEILVIFLSGEWEVEKVKKGPLKPEKDGLYWIVNDYGNVEFICYDDEEDEYCLTHNFIFQTKEEAKDYKWFLDKVDEYKRPFEPEGYNYTFYYVYKTKKVEIACNSSYSYQGAIYFGAKENIDNFLEEVGETRIKKYIFGVYD